MGGHQRKGENVEMASSPSTDLGRVGGWRGEGGKEGQDISL